ncbi:unnamed protein product, partial [Lampetra fluviatilis]
RLDLGELKHLQFISEGAFEGLGNLQYLNLGMCMLREVPNLEPLARLEELDLSGNRVESLRHDSFRGLGGLRKLWMMHAGVRLVRRGALDGLRSLQELNLAHNRLAALPHDLFGPLGGLRRVHLHHNPWACDCDVAWLARWLRDNESGNVTCCARCSSPPELKGRYVSGLDPPAASGAGTAPAAASRCRAPVIVEGPHDLNVSEGAAAEMRCRAPSPTSSVTWLGPDGAAVAPALVASRRLSLTADGSLNFTSVAARDAGLYTCLVANAAGNASASATLA